MKKFRNPALMSAAELDEAADAQMDAYPDGSPFGTLLIDEIERREELNSPALMSAAELAEAISDEMRECPGGSARASELIDTQERREGAWVVLAESYDQQPPAVAHAVR